MPINVYRASKLLHPYKPESRKITVCGKDYTLLPIGRTAASDPDLRCTNPGSTHVPKQQTQQDLPHNIA